MWSLRAVAGQFEVIPKKLFVVRMSTVFDDGLCAFFRTLATKIGNTLLGDNDIDIVLRVVVVGYHRYDCTDLTFLSHRRTSEDRDVSVAGKVSRTTDTVHHFCSADMGRVYVAVQVDFDGCIDRNDTETAYYFRAV